MSGQRVAYATNTSSSNILFGAAAVGIAAGAVGAVGLVDEHEGGLLMIGGTIRTKIRRDTNRADHCERGLGCEEWLSEEEVEEPGRALGVSGGLL